MAKIAVIKTGGKQYLVQENQEIKIEKISPASGKDFVFDQVLMFSKDGKKIELGKPTLKDVKVTAKVLEQGKNKKVCVVHYKSKTRQHKVYGHRQPFTKVKITKIG